MSGTLRSLLTAALAIPDAVSLYNQRGDFVAANQNVQFPTDLSDAYIHMRFSKYVRRSIREQPRLDPQEGIKLPIPSRLVDTQSLEYSQENLGPMYGAAAEAVSAAGNPSLETLGQQLIGGATGVGASQLQALLAGQQGALGAISSVTGLAINPFQTMLFKSPGFKSHNFSWKLVPSNEDESNRIESIVRLFKYHSLPAVSYGSGVLFAFPDILEIKLFPIDTYTYRFKPCVVENVSVNYAPNGPSFYRGTRAPTAVELSISLKEIEIWTKADYFRNGDGSIDTNARQPNLTPGG